MKLNAVRTAPVLLSLLAGGCASTSEKTTSLCTAYAVIAVLSLLLLIGYCLLIRKKNVWMLLLFSSVLVVNVGYFALAVSRTLEEALLANRISYLGSVLLPLSMLMTILDTVHIRWGRWLTVSLLCISFGVFLVAASPGYLDIYYEEVSLQTVNGAAVLNKVYGPWHKLYFFYLFLYFAAMVCVILHTLIKRRIPSVTHGIILSLAVLANIGVWMMGQLVRMEFEMLSVSYILSELFLLSLYMMLQDSEKSSSPVPADKPAPDILPPQPGYPLAEHCLRFTEGLRNLTPTERTIYDLYLEGRTTREIMDRLNIKENTLKYHNKNLYSKLGVSSRKQLTEIARAINSGS